MPEDRAARFQDVEGVRPEVQSQDVALVRQQVVGDVQPCHRGEMRAHDAVDDERPHLSRVVAAAFEGVERRFSNREPAAIAFVPLRHV